MKELIKQIGKEADLTIESFTVRVKILDVRSAYGRIDYEVTPVTGSRTRWVSGERLNFSGAERATLDLVDGICKTCLAEEV